MSRLLDKFAVIENLQKNQAAANRHAPQQHHDAEKIQSGVLGESGIQGCHETLRIKEVFRQTWRPNYEQAAAEMLPSFSRRGQIQRVQPLQIFYCPATTITGVLLAMTGPCPSEGIASIRMTCPGSGGTRPMRRASRSIRSGSRREASSRRSA